MRNEQTRAEQSGSPAADETATFQFGWRALVLDFVFWTILAVLTTTNRLLDPFRPDGRRNPGIEGIAYWFLDSYLWALLTPLIFWLAWRFGSSRRHWMTNAAVLAAIGGVIAAGLGVVSQLIARELFGFRRFGPPGARGASLVGMVFTPGFLSDFITFTGILAAGFAWDYFRRYRSREAEAVRLQAQAASLQAQLAEARLSVLRNQLNPHFLFNTLNAVSALVAKDPKGVRRMISRLSDLLRYSLLGDQPQEITVEEELKMLGQYLEILEIRYQGRLETHIEADPDLGDALVPSLILQPLAENAMTHGVGKAGGHGRIEVRATRAGDRLVLSVSDTGPAGGELDAAELSPGGAGGGMGLRNTRARLAELYGEDQRLELRPRSDGGMIAEIVLPLRRATSVRREHQLAQV
jgi:two-component system, LytTR family, sensor kinase